MQRFIIKQINEVKAKRIWSAPKDNKVNNKEDMNSTEKLEAIQQILKDTDFESVEKKVKKVKKEKGLIERTETSKIVITEDNKQLLND